MSWRRRLQRVPISIRLSVMIAAILVVSVGAIAYWAYSGMVELPEQRAHSEAMALVQSVDRSVVVSMFDRHSGDLDRLREIIAEATEDYANRDDIQSVVVLSHAGRVIFADDPAVRVGDVVSREKNHACTICHDSEPAAVTEHAAQIRIDDEENLVRAVSPILNLPGCSTAACHAHDPGQSVLGIITVDQSLEPAKAQVRSDLVQLGVLALCIAVAGPLLALVLMRNWWGRPLESLLEGIARVSEGNLEEVIPRAEGELGKVAYAFNQMQERLSVSQKQLLRSEKLASLGKIAAGVAHEINNPLTGILTYSEELIEDSDPDDPLLDDYQVIHRETMRCREIVRNLLDFARRAEPQARPVQVNQVLEKTVELVSHLAQFRNIEIVTDLHDDLPLVNADTGQLQQVFLNFLVNAADAMPGGGEVRIVSRTRRDGRGIVVSVTDHGPGIPEEVLDHIFEPFFSTKGGRSTGLGLSVSWGIIEQHHGRIEVQSEAGAGTTFRVHLPSVDAQPGEGGDDGGQAAHPGRG